MDIYICIMAHKLRNIKTFESSISGVFSFNTPIGKESKVEKVTEGPNYQFYQDIENIKNMVASLSKMDTTELDSLLTDNNESKEEVRTAADALKNVYDFLYPRTDDAEDKQEEEKSKKANDEDE